ncbi:hypothetical protein [Desulfosporosinus meridiei]|uniref:Uncharacterized protein n=1 Tax=Desulfosporosinus meridiei (strain ATCC BAA-275 / DSM 13257 / KCTC 12902 / NCIMB 13706 / S10) TaxID=768704 RepID=J7IKH9_DESMD|nr:hypothetical protein [Desulfosporosinus meridiei]AFQ42277.1 hypothetical protein Desmer_0213 [Desulfosporosinus meridiei DSM 13257]
MNYELLKTSAPEFRDASLRQELGREKCKILDKYQLRSNTRLYWERYYEHQPIQEYFSHKFARKASPLGMIFYIYKLCYAKVKYFQQNWGEFVPCIYNWQVGLFEETELWDLEFIRHSRSGLILDLRNLARITKYEDFLALCDYLNWQGVGRPIGAPIL